MKASLSFSLPEDEEEYENAKNGAKYRALIEDIEDYVSAKLDHGELDDGELAAYDDVICRIRGVAEDMGVELY